MIGNFDVIIYCAYKNTSMLLPPPPRTHKKKMSFAETQYLINGMACIKRAVLLFFTQKYGLIGISEKTGVEVNTNCELLELHKHSI